MIRFFVQGEPRAMSVGGIARAGNRVFQKRRSAPWAILVGQIGREHAPAAPLDGALTFTATFYVPRPQGAKPAKVPYPLKRPDVDNLLHKLTDQFNGVFWRDDSQIVDVIARKRFADHHAAGWTGVEIVVETING